jgi:hypothetical protein
MAGLPELVLVADPLVGDPLAAHQHGAAPMMGQRILNWKILNGALPRDFSSSLFS